MPSPLQPIRAALNARLDDEPVLRLQAVHFVGPGSLKLELVLPPEAEGHALRWHLFADGVLAWQIVAEEAEVIELLETDELLREYHEPWAELTFFGRPRSVLAAAGALWSVAARWNGRSYFNQSPETLLAGGFGQLACGPASVIAELESALAPFELKLSVIPLRSSWRLRPKARLLRFGDNYIVGERFAVEPVPA